MLDQKDIDKYWENEVCGIRYISPEIDQSKHYIDIINQRYFVEPYIREFAFGKNNKSLSKKNILEIGVGAGADFIGFLESGANCYGIDATDAAIKETKKNIKYALINKKYNLEYLDKGTAEVLPFKNDFFDIVYSHGVLHHAKNTMKCLAEAERVLKKGGLLKLMVYSNFSATGIMIWILYGLMKFNIFISQEELLFKYLESPGTKSYSKKEFRKIIEGFSFRIKRIQKYAGCSDLLLIKPSIKYKNNPLFNIANKFYPRFFVKKFQRILGLSLIVEAVKK